MQSTIKKILVVEDEPQVRENIVSILGFEGFYRTAAENGLIGLQRAKEEMPDLIICDVMMPELNGYEFIESLRQDPQMASIPVIFLTAKADRIDFRQGMELGADDYLTKPFTPSELRRAIEVQFKKQTIIAQKNQVKFQQLCNTITVSLPHELHTPLQSIIALPQLLMEEWDFTPDTEKLEMIETVYTSGKRLYGLTQNFLLYAKLEVTISDAEKVAGIREYAPHTFLKVMVEETAYQEAENAQRTLDLEIDLQDEAVQISSASLKKVIQELINNAFKFSQSGSKVSVIGVPSNNLYSLYVIDYGRGMTSEQIANVGAYIQFNHKLYEQNGAGLGLITSKRLIELYGGEFTIESIPGKQTIVRIALPMPVTSQDDELGKN
ncbi:MAG: response regulator [Nostoc sp. DedVER02]|uniref:hybrid sensor histidine kinase/response regulator n=1 Tax=unclassified Nostoc TaxID=2593658 RepID=UPI002AD566BD|nr:MULTISPECIES: response regulator [unclassified Nostoc]MDZ7986245.1 response regulator [Nostoc sp. DedVER02]MDZ8112554.1 response regulator [Nostoc sp. DedVER01b]